jgi:hypothetical protein
VTQGLNEEAKTEEGNLGEEVVPPTQTTQTFQEQAFKHVLEQVINRTEESELQQALKRSRVTDLRSLVKMPASALLELKYLDQPEGSTGAKVKKGAL